MAILVTGGAGYIGSHMVLRLMEIGHDVVVIDNLCNAPRESLERVSQLTGKEVTFIEGDIRDHSLLDYVFADFEISDVLHFAGLKSVGESVNKPLAYFENNVAGTITLCQAMMAAGVFRLVFSSSATVYGDATRMPLSESAPTGQPTNAYGHSKLMVEEVLRKLARSDPRWSIALLRYFNPVGAHPSGLIGEDPSGKPNNLLPFISQVAIGHLPALSVFGDDYPTPDGTGVRDYIHVMDLVEGHLAAMRVLADRPGVNVWNLGTGQGYSVLEMVRAFEMISQRDVAYRIVPRRDGDIAECWADASLAAHELGWKAQRGLTDMIADTWRWQSNNPEGYPSKRVVRRESLGKPGGMTNTLPKIYLIDTTRTNRVAS
ncbi:UDP-glucose 4-epimerase GalE [Chromohalobacter japonicus]|uniref:UDP-glucose 4-epimerase n=1 Tax=Chromohalobacter japonicus TaxID=223900 RepID=A0A1Q8T8W6_9GAMM|nr:UDP-glucose 4-epimerase GalE [Chromohalobacter japonicus]OLO10048.1 UDP-glucose 4-epimerase GalE [Chromohalobacter japonicus]